MTRFERPRLPLFRRAHTGFGAAAAVVVAALALAGCSSVQDGYPSPFGAEKPTPLPDRPGRGLWNPPPAGSAAAASPTLSLYAALPQPDPVTVPSRPAETPGLPDAADIAREEQGLTTARDTETARVRRRIETNR